MSVVMLILANVFSTSQKQYRLGIKKITQNEEAALAVRDFEKITRGATIILKAEPNTLTFLTYLKGDDHPDSSKISYYLDNNTLYRSVTLPTVDGSGGIVYPDSGKSVKIIASNVRSSQLFSYFNEANAELNFPVQTDIIRMIKLSVEIDENPSVPPESAVELTAVQLRNLKNNL
jgi:hypothetical protein